MANHTFLKAIKIRFIAQASGGGVLDRNTGQGLFKWLALTEALSFEDLEFLILNNMLSLAELESTSASILSPLITRPHRYIIPGTNRGLILYKDECIRQAALISSRSDIICLYLSPHASRDLVFRAARHFNRYADLSNRTCLLYTISNCFSDYHILDQCKAQAQVEWNGPEEKSNCKSGMLFSSGWREGVSEHVSLRLARFASEC
ncbi:hypothetical protein [Pseudomonas savastanoi]|uniref:hypothetical protein n=1 Tax=Pseudomonas savastanoi TaxID=29438 RepID=UPI0011C3829F|nr:hypothetical protein [Pseudomonas savastanoi]